MRDVDRVLDALDEAVALAVSVVEDKVVADAAVVVRRARRRLGFLGESVVVALVGGTGSGKSSLVNALAGETVATTGVLRPTTQTALAWLPHQPEPGLTRLLDALEVSGRVGHELTQPLCILDMPDVDSVAGAHREEVERLLPQVDAVIWVFDPEKYNDRVVHEDFLQHLSGYEGQFLFVLNQIDRIFESDRPLLIDDLKRQLLDDGFIDPVVLATAAAPDVGSPLGIEMLWDRLDSMMHDKRLVIEKLAADAAEAAKSLESAAGLDRDVDWRTLWDDARHRTAASLGAAAVSPDTQRTIADAGRSAALARHPVGLLGMLRRGAVGRALALDRAVPAAMRGWSARAGEARQSVADLIGTVIGIIRGRTGRVLAEKFDDRWIDAQIAAAMDRALRSVEPEIRRPSNVGLLGWAGLIAMAVGAGWWWSVPSERGEIPWHFIVLAGGLAMFVVSRWAIRLFADRRSVEVTNALREALVADVSRSLDSLIGSPVAAELRGRAELRAALAAVSVVSASNEETR